MSVKTIINFFFLATTIFNLSIQYPYLKGKSDPISPFIY